MSLREQLEAGMRAAEVHTGDGRHRVVLRLEDGAVMVSLFGARSTWHRGVALVEVEAGEGVIARLIVEGAEALG